MLNAYHMEQVDNIVFRHKIYKRVFGLTDGSTCREQGVVVLLLVLGTLWWLAHLAYEVQSIKPVWDISFRSFSSHIWYSIYSSFSQLRQSPASAIIGECRGSHATLISIPVRRASTVLATIRIFLLRMLTRA